MVNLASPRGQQNAQRTAGAEPEVEVELTLKGQQQKEGSQITFEERPEIGDLSRRRPMQPQAAPAGAGAPAAPSGAGEMAGGEQAGAGAGAAPGGVGGTTPGIPQRPGEQGRKGAPGGFGQPAASPSVPGTSAPSTPAVPGGAPESGGGMMPETAPPATEMSKQSPRRREPRFSSYDMANLGARQGAGVPPPAGTPPPTEGQPPAEGQPPREEAAGSRAGGRGRGGGGGAPIPDEKKQRDVAGQLRQQKAMEKQRREKQAKVAKGVEKAEKKKKKATASKRFRRRVIYFIITNIYWIGIGVIIVLSAVFVVGMIGWAVHKWGYTVLKIMSFLAWIPGMKSLIFGWK